MTALTCNKPGCTLAQTGTCILDYDPTTCPERLALIDAVPESTISAADNTTQAAKEEYAQFKSSYALSPDQAKAIMNERYCKIIGVLGIPGAGKTACLASLYLLLSHQKLSGFQFRNSKTIMAFEEISRGAKWNGTMQPQDLVAHTAIPDGRNAGYLHLRLCSDANKFCDLLLPDVPGEWTNTLVENNRTDRLSYLKAAECLWIFVNGQELHNVNTRNHTIHRLGLLFERLSIYFDKKIPKVTLVVSHKDQISIDEKHLRKIEHSAESQGFSIKIHFIASFSTNNAVAAGDGIAELISDLFAGNDNSSVFSAAQQPIGQTPTRQMLQYGQNI